jgi:hypothetical protein
VDERALKNLLKAGGTVLDAEYNLSLKLEALEAVLDDMPRPVPDEWGEQFHEAWSEALNMRAYLAESVRRLKRRMKEVKGSE